MGERIKGITRRVKRLFGAKADEPDPKARPRKDFSTTRVIRPEDLDADRDGRSRDRTRAHERPTTRRRRRPEEEKPPKEAVEIHTLACGTVHVRFHRVSEVKVKDPITRRIERRIVVRGLKESRIERTTTYYDKSGTLIGSGDDWGTT